MIAGATSQAWQRASVATPLPEDVARAIVSFGADHPSMLRNPEELAGSLGASGALAELAQLRPVVEWIRSELADGPGFAAVSLGSLGLAYARLAFGLVGVMLAPPIERYGFHYAVADTGQSYEEKAIPISMTRASTGLHTDSSARDCVPGIIALLCERPSPDGGDSLISDAFAACRWIAENRPDIALILQRSFVRQIVTPGLDKGLESLRRNRFPIVRWEPKFEFRYMRYWIVEGQRELGQPLDAEALAALDLLDETLMRPEFLTTFRMAAGDMLFVNNTHLVHGRTAYDAVPAGGRLLWRMWLDEQASVRELA
jgi:alpha-ketoglutarate-dependent taurine dioxygenase